MRLSFPSFPYPWIWIWRATQFIQLDPTSSSLFAYSTLHCQLHIPFVAYSTADSTGIRELNHPSLISFFFFSLPLLLLLFLLCPFTTLPPALHPLLLYFSFYPPSLSPLLLSAHSTLPPSTGVHTPHILVHHSFTRESVGKWPASLLPGDTHTSTTNLLPSTKPHHPLSSPTTKSLAHARADTFFRPPFFSFSPHTSYTLTIFSTRNTKNNSTFLFTSPGQKAIIQQQQICRSNNDDNTNSAMRSLSHHTSPFM